MKGQNEELERNVLIIFLLMLGIGVLFAFLGNLSSTTNMPKDKPLWMNVTANHTDITFSYNAENVEGFDSLALQTSWWDPHTEGDRELYSMESGLLKNNVSFPKLVTISSSPMIVGVTVKTHPREGITQTRRYIWKVTQEPFTLGLDKPTVDYIR